MTIGSYEEELADGGKLRVCLESWEIAYYYSGPDLRYNGTSVRISGADVPKLINEYKSAFLKYLEIKMMELPGAEVLLKFSLNLTIRVGGPFDGVCMASYHDPVRNDTALSNKVKAYSFAMERSIKAQEMLRRF